MLAPSTSAIRTLLLDDDAAPELQHGSQGGPVQQRQDGDEDQHAADPHAGTAEQDGRIVASGGRVLNITARGASLQEARDRAYAMLDRIEAPSLFCRRDIGWRAL